MAVYQKIGRTKKRSYLTLYFDHVYIVSKKIVKKKLKAPFFFLRVTKLVFIVAFSSLIFCKKKKKTMYAHIRIVELRKRDSYRKSRRDHKTLKKSKKKKEGILHNSECVIHREREK